MFAKLLVLGSVILWVYLTLRAIFFTKPNKKIKQTANISQPPDADYFYELACEYQKKGEHNEAIQYFNRAIIFKGDATHYNNRGCSRLKIGDVQGAISDFSIAISRHPDSSLYWRNRGTAYYESKLIDLALDDWRKSAELGSERAVELINQHKQESLSEQVKKYKDSADDKYLYSDYEGCIKDYTKAIKLTPNNADCYIKRGISYEVIGDDQSALVDYEKAYELGSKKAAELLVKCKLRISSRNPKKPQEKKPTYILVFDTETSGLPLDEDAPVTDVDNWPRLVQLAYILYDNDANVISRGDYIIKPNGFYIPYEASQIHGITTSTANRLGKDVTYVLRKFEKLVDQSDYIVGHNIDFDINVVGAEFIRHNIENLLESKESICTMLSAMELFENEDENFVTKFPSLSELYYSLFLEVFEGAHDAAIDVEITAECFWELKRLGMVFIDSDDEEEKLRKLYGLS
jgi:DNA polymerase-3 subunit epsilon